MKRKQTMIMLQTAIYVILTIGAFFSAFPVIWMLSCSFKENSSIFDYPPRLITETFSLDAYAAILTNSTQLRFFINSYLVSILVTVLPLVLASCAAYSFSRYDFPGKNVLNTVIIGVQGLPQITLLIPYFGLIVTLQLYDTYLALILTYMIFTLPYAILILTSYFNTVPKELDEAVKIDGASSFCTLWKIILPISKPGIVAVGIRTFMQAWNEYLFALTLTKSLSMRTVPVGIQMLMGEYSYQWNEMMAMSILGSLPVLILYLAFQKYFIGGLAAGAVKE